MAANPSAPWIPPPPPARFGVGRVIAVVVGALLLLPAFGLLAGGGLLLWADQNERRADGYLLSPADSFATEGHAMLSERIELGTGADWVPLSSALGTARVVVSSTDTADEIFVGVAPTADVRAYLDGVRRTVIDDLGVDASAADRLLLPGGAPSGPPTDQDFWTVEASGPGMQQLSWEPTDGSWTLVVMNADGSAGVSVDARIGATAPGLGGLAWGLLGGGAFLLLMAVLVLVLALRRPARPAAAAPAYGGPPFAAPSGPQPPWAPPAPVDRRTAVDAGPTASTDAGVRGRRTD